MEKKVSPNFVSLYLYTIDSNSRIDYNKLDIVRNKHYPKGLNNLEINKQIYADCKANNIIVNVADTPSLCDFYLGGIVTKGNIKIAISTNGKSPTLAKRLRQFFEEVIPENIDELAENLNKFRKTIKGDFSDKVNQLNKLTERLL